MSFGVFEAAVGSEVEVGLAKQASVDKMAAAVYDVREKLGPILFASRDREEFRHKVAMMKADQSVYKIISAHLMPLPKVIRDIVGKNSVLEKEFCQRLADATPMPDVNTDDPTQLGAGLGAPPGPMPQVSGVGGPLTDPVGGSGVDRGIMQNQFGPGTTARRRRADVPGLPGVAEPDKLMTSDELDKQRPLGQGQSWGQMGNMGQMGQSNQLPNPLGKSGRRVRADGTVDVKPAFEDHRGQELEPEGDFKGYLDKMDQGAESKIGDNFVGEGTEHTEDPTKHNFASRQTVARYTKFCKQRGLSPIRLSSLDRFAEATPLTDAGYFRLSATITAWENEHKPKVPSTKLKKQDKVASGRDVNDDHALRATDNALGHREQTVNPYTGKPGDRPTTRTENTGYKSYSSEPVWQHPSGQSMSPYENTGYHQFKRNPSYQESDSAGRHRAMRDPMRHYIAWCRKHGYKRLSARNINIYAGRDLQLAYFLAMRCKEAIKVARRRRATGEPEPVPGVPSGAKTPVVDIINSLGDPAEVMGPRHQGRRRQAAPDYLQKADDALTQLLNQKAEEFQQTIAPLQQALITVQQAEQLQQQQNPLNVLPTPGTVNVMPGQSDSTPGQLGMPDPNQPDISGLVQALQPGGGAMGGIAPQESPAGGGQGAPPPAAAGGGLPPDMDPSQKAARRGKGQGAFRPRIAAAGPSKGAPWQWTQGTSPDHGYPVHRPVSIVAPGSFEKRQPTFEIHQQSSDPNGPVNYLQDLNFSADDGPSGSGVQRNQFPNVSAAMQHAEAYLPGFFSGDAMSQWSPHPQTARYFSPSTRKRWEKNGRQSLARPRQAAGVGELWDRWKQNRGEQGDALRGDEVDYSRFQQEHGVGDRALQNLKKRNETPDFAPINGQGRGRSPQGITVGRKQACWPGCHENEAHAAKFHSKDKKDARRRQAGPYDPGPEYDNVKGTDDFHTFNDRGQGSDHPGRSRGWKGQFAQEPQGPYDGEYYTKGRAQVRGGPGPDVAKYWLTTPHGIHGPHHNVHDAFDAAEPFLAQDAEIGKGQGTLFDAPRAKGAARQRSPLARRKRANPAPFDQGKHSIGDPEDGHTPIANPVNPYTGGGMFDDAPDLTPRAARKAYRKHSWSGWGPAVHPKARKVAGWEWDNHLNGYLANTPQHFACDCGEQFPTPSGFQRCACGKQYNSYVIGTGGSAREASAEKFIVREVPVRPDVIVANRKLATGKGSSPDWVDPFPDAEPWPHGMPYLRSPGPPPPQAGPYPSTKNALEGPFGEEGSWSRYVEQKARQRGWEPGEYVPKPGEKEDPKLANRKLASSGEWATNPSEGSFLGHTPDHKIPQYLEHLRGKVRGQNISMGELSDLQGLAEHGYIHPDDMELHEAAGTPEEDFMRGQDRDPDNDPFDPREFGAKRKAMRRGAPFAGYEDFDDCTSKNSDKRDSSAYCGEIKHRTEDKKARKVQLVDKHGNIHNLVDPGELGDGDDPGHPTFKKQPKDWARRGDGAKWIKNPIG